MIPSARYLALLIPVLAFIASLACSDDAAPGDCIDAARDAGVPDRVIEWMKDPVEEWGTIERIAIREALEKFGIGEFCADVSAKLDIAESSATSHALDIAKDVAQNTPVPSAPTPRPPSTPLPAPTAAQTLVPTQVSPTPDPTQIGQSGATRITHITFSGTAGKPGSRFTVHFNLPVVIDLPQDFDIDYDESPLRLRVGRPEGYDDRLHYYDNLYELPVLSSALRIRRPTDKLSFGPVEKEFSVAYYLETTEALRGGSGSLVFNQRSIRLPGDTVFLNPGYDTNVADSKLISCVAFMEFAGIPSQVMRSVKDLLSESLTDREREEWRRFLADEEYIRYSGNIWDRSGMWTKEPCSSLWSEDNSESNATKRNRDWEEDCFDADGSAREDMLTLANLPYAELNATDRIVLQMIMGDSDCRVFYPQLFYGRWIPMTRN